MFRSKVFSLALVAAFALSALVAPAAFATYDSEVASTTLSGSQVTTNSFTTDVGTLKCSIATVSGVSTGTAVSGGFTASEWGLHPNYGTCSLSGQPVDFFTAGCGYLLATAVSKKAAATILCETGKAFVIKDTVGLGCEVTIKAQTPGGSAGFTNNGTGTGRTVLVTWSLTGIAYTWTAGCPNSKGKAGSNTNGTYSGSVSVKGENAAKAQVGIWVT
jgi:hypothetical protein